MSPDQGAGTFDLELPEPMVSRLARHGWIEARLHGSTVALCLSARVQDAGLAELELKEPFQVIALAARSIRQAALQDGLNLPVVVVLELAGFDPGIDLSFRTSFDRWASDQDWHRGDFALYLTPPVVLSEPPDGLPWKGPRNRGEMIEHLLGPGPTKWQLTQMERSSLTTVAQRIEDWTKRSEVSRSELQGDFLLTLAAALKHLDRERLEGRPAPGGAFQSVIDGWITRNLLEEWRSEEAR